MKFDLWFSFLFLSKRWEVQSGNSLDMLYITLFITVTLHAERSAAR